MKLSPQLRFRIVYAIALLYILLFTYAAVSKLLDYEDFSIKIGQSPLLSAFAGYIAIGVPLIELIIVVMLCIPSLRITALFTSFCLMIMFTVYIYIILNYSSYIPCSCGGVLQDLGWTEHLIFNVAFIILALLALLIGSSDDNWLSRQKPLRFIVIIFGSAFLSAGAVVTLYILSEDIMQTRNTFVRRFPDHPQPEHKKFDLEFNSYYFSGIENGKIYLGNSTAPLNLSIIDTGLLTRERVKIKIDSMDFPFHSLQVMVDPPNFYIADGTVPCVYHGNTFDWKATYVNKPVPHFSLVALIDSSRLTIRTTSLTKRSNILSLHSPQDTASQKTKFTLQKQVDGIFDTDGMLLYNPQLERIHYIYFYRNQYLTFDRNLKLVGTGKTIDTITKAAIKVAYTENGETTMSAPPVTVNKNTAVYKNLLFVHSERIGKYEGKKILKHAVIIDVYDHTNGNYISSMYIYNVEQEKMRSFRIDGNNIYTLTGNYLTAVRLPGKIKKALQ